MPPLALQHLQARLFHNSVYVLVPVAAPLGPVLLPALFQQPVEPLVGRPPVLYQQDAAVWAARARGLLRDRRREKTYYSGRGYDARWASCETE